jgi:hypothetical protein
MSFQYANKSGENRIPTLGQVTGVQTRLIIENDGNFAPNSKDFTNPL